MPTYRYHAVDGGGRAVSGKITAADVRQAQQLLRQRGLIATHLTIADTPDGPPLVPQTDGVASAAAWEYTRVPPYVMASWLQQLRMMLKAGMQPALAFQELSGRVRYPELQRASLQFAQEAARGVAISQAMERFPQLFPRFMVGAFRAAEAGGYLPDMLEQLAAYFEQRQVVRRWSRLTLGCLGSTVLLLPVVGTVSLGLVAGLRRFAGGDTGAALVAIGAGVGESFLRFGLPLLLILLALMGLGYLITSFERLAARLHLMGAGFSTYADWVRAQALTHYLYHLGQLTQAGISPATAHQLAAGAVPNRALAETLTQIDLGRAKAAAHVDAALERSGLFPIEEVMMARTGAHTGQLPQTLQYLADRYQTHADERAQSLPVFFRRVLFLLALLSMAAGSALLMWGYYGHIFEAVDQFMGVSE